MPSFSIVLFSSVIAAFSALGGGVEAGAVTHGASAKSPSSMATMPRAAHVQSATKVPTLHTEATNVNGKTETILVDAQGLPLYYYQQDTPKKSLVTCALARLWPPLTSASPTATGTHGKLTTTKDANGRQVAYNGHFLYTFIQDTPGQVTGQGVENFFVATPGLKTIGGAHTTAAPATTSGGGYGY